MTPTRQELQAQLDNINKQLDKAKDKATVQGLEKGRAIIISQMMNLI